MDSPRYNRHMDRLKATQEPGYPCLCLCQCPTRHYNLKVYLCDSCEKHRQDGLPNHGEIDDAKTS